MRSFIGWTFSREKISSGEGRGKGGGAIGDDRTKEEKEKERIYQGDAYTLLPE